MSDHKVLKFDDLNLKFGQIVQIHPDLENNTERFDCLLVGCLPGESIIISIPQGAEAFPELQEGQQVVIRVMSANGVALFPTRVLFISEVPVLLVYLDIPKAIKFRLVRNATRVDVALPILAAILEPGGKRGMAGRISDISLGGAQLELDEGIVKVGSKLEIKGKFQVGQIQRLVTLTAVVRRKNKKSEKNWAYGVQFAEEDEDKLLILFGYIFNSMAFGSVQTIS